MRANGPLASNVAAARLMHSANVLHFNLALGPGQAGFHPADLNEAQPEPQPQEADLNGPEAAVCSFPYLHQ